MFHRPKKSANFWHLSEFQSEIMDLARSQQIPTRIGIWTLILNEKAAVYTNFARNWLNHHDIDVKDFRMHFLLEVLNRLIADRDFDVIDWKTLGKSDWK